MPTPNVDIPDAEVTKYRQLVEKIMSVGTALRHGLEFEDYITSLSSGNDPSSFTTYTVDKKLYQDACYLIFGSGYAGLSESESEIFLNSCNKAVKKFRAKIYQNCMSSWKVMYPDVQLHMDIMIGESFFVIRNERESCLTELNNAINVYGLEDLLLNSPYMLTGERSSEKIPYGTLIRWFVQLPMEVLDKELTWSYLSNHKITMMDMLYAAYAYGRIQSILELELLQNYKVKLNDILKTPQSTYKLRLNAAQRCISWDEQPS